MRLWLQRILFYRIWRRIIWYKFTEFSEEHAASTLTLYIENYPLNPVVWTDVLLKAF
jgi:hypothetical protein